MAVVAKFRQLQPGSRWTNRVLELDFTGNYTTNGDPLDLRPQSVINKASEMLGGAGSYETLPDTAYELNASGGYYFEIVQSQSPGTLNGFLVKIYAPGGAELAAGAYPAAITSPLTPFLMMMTHKTNK